MSENRPKEATVVDLKSFRQKKEVADNFARGRTPLYVSHLDGKVQGSPHLKRPEAEDFGTRLQRIKMSLEKINLLMSQLKKNAEGREI
jgi:hypothetical protein